MISNIKVEKTITLVLNTKEALWLKGMVQNPIGVSPDEEDSDNREMRAKFWTALKEVQHA